ncbi:MAG: hypothetical protein IMW90_08840 [Thermogemmatispora sp.]|nr:hypothetical protein [Thermogemmatispora sp.]MBE3565818.1 hypothetical protein [Thermogemmatispora sp.]
MDWDRRYDDYYGDRDRMMYEMYDTIRRMYDLIREIHRLCREIQERMRPT